MNIQPIETLYKGYRFRSRLEARWAVFFEAAHIPWVYEKEGFRLANGAVYLPDFWIPLPSHLMDAGAVGWGYWLEVKGQAPTNEEKEKCRLLAEETGHVVFLVEGAPGCTKVSKWQRDGALAYDGRINSEDPEFSLFRLFNNGKSPVGACDAIGAALSARFEHGETPA